MITGHNTDVEYAGRVYHVQTEDKGNTNPLIETLVYSRGAILDCRRYSYAESAKNGIDEKSVIKLMDQQHQRMVREVRNGMYDPEGPKPFGFNLISNRTLDEVVLEWLASDRDGEGLGVELSGGETFFESSEVSIGLFVKRGGDKPGPVEGAAVSVRLLDPRSKAVKVFEGKTGPEGTVEASIQIPDLGGRRGALVFQVRHGNRAAELTRPVLPSP